MSHWITSCFSQSQVLCVSMLVWQRQPLTAVFHARGQDPRSSRDPSCSQHSANFLKDKPFPSLVVHPFIFLLSSLVL